ncbi:hypothetical protein Tco_1038380 [Tanacetum coccineum]
MQAEEQEKLSIEEKSKLFVQLLEARKKHFAAMKAQEMRNKPPTKSQKRNTMVNTFVDMDTELVEGSGVRAEGSDTRVEGSSKRAGEDIVDYKIYKEGKTSFFQIIRADVKARFKKTEPVNYMDNFLLLNLKTMFEHHVEENNILYYLLVEKMYLLTNHTLHQMFNDVKLQVDYECKMAFKLQGYVPE